MAKKSARKQYFSPTKRVRARLHSGNTITAKKFIEKLNMEEKKNGTESRKGK